MNFRAAFYILNLRATHLLLSENFLCFLVSYPKFGNPAHIEAQTPNISSNGVYSQSAQCRNQSTILPQLHHSYNAPRCSSVTSATTQLTSRGDSQQQICTLFILSLNFSPQYSSQHYLTYALFNFFANKKLLKFYKRNFKLFFLSTGQKPKPLNLRIDR
jgi:hypothetical protein